MEIIEKNNSRFNRINTEPARTTSLVCFSRKLQLHKQLRGRLDGQLGNVRAGRELGDGDRDLADVFGLQNRRSMGGIGRLGAGIQNRCVHFAGADGGDADIVGQLVTGC